MRTLSAVKQHCRVETGDDGLKHWIWTLSTYDGYANVTAPHYGKDPTGKKIFPQRGRRAVWHLKTRAAIPDGSIVYSRCAYATCINPACLAMGTRAEYGQFLHASGAWKNNIKRRLAGVRNSSRQRKITPEMVLDILQSDEVARVLAERYHVHRSTIIRYRAGGQSDLGGFFAGLAR